ncbi:hypothetical protein [Actinoplanes sp. NPDC049802]|uniref:hypothetical protein n=1 Tax=Actinoplanes sp. NPDC049802 TaxID=3154742 RepID=UPI0033EF72CB
MAVGGAGCSAAADGGVGANPAPSSAAPVPSDPAQAFAAAKDRLGTESARFARDLNYAPLDFTGVVNAQTRNWEISGEDHVVRRIGSDVHVRVTGDKLDTIMMSKAVAAQFAAGGWIRTRLPNFRESGVIFHDEFPWNLTGLATRAKGVTATGDHSYTGMATINEPGSLSGSTRKLPVRGDLDEAGRFSRITATVTGEGKSDVTRVVTFTDFGGPADITAPPAAEVSDGESQMLLIFLSLR